MAELSPGTDTPVVDAPMIDAPAAEAAPVPEATAAPVVAPEGEKQPEVTPDDRLTKEEVNKIVQKRVAQAERKAIEKGRLEAERDHYKRIAEQAAAPAKAEAGEPKAEDFKDWESFQDAKVNWRIERGIAEKLAAREKESAAQREQREATDRASTLRQKFAPAAQKYADFDEVAMADDLPIAPPMAAFMAESDAGGDLAYHLGTHKDEAARIAAMTPIAQIREMANLEAKLKAAPTPTKTPAPIVPSGTKSTVDKDPSKMSDKEYKDWRLRQIAQRR